MSIRKVQPDVYQDLIRRLQRIEGQARGLRRMLEEDQDCESILIQVSALKAAVGKVGLKLLGCEIGIRAVEDIKKGGDGNRATTELLESFMRLS